MFTLHCKRVQKEACTVGKTMKNLSSKEASALEERRGKGVKLSHAEIQALRAMGGNEEEEKGERRKGRSVMVGGAVGHRRESVYAVFRLQNGDFSVEEKTTSVVGREVPGTATIHRGKALLILRSIREGGCCPNPLDLIQRPSRRSLPMEQEGFDWSKYDQMTK